MENPMARRSMPYIVRTVGGTPVVVVRREIWHPPTDVYETDSEIIVKVEVAGVHEDDMEVSLDEGILRVSGRRADCSRRETVAVHRLEIQCGEFETHVHLPHAIRADADIQCTYASGILTIVLPKELAHKVHVERA